jgi:two-component system, chemotaxis family, protein-glutamate methylesterase/glutaminase
MPGRDIIVVGASAGGVEALATLARGLPADLPAAVFVVLHVAPHSTSVLPQILSRAGPLPAAHAVEDEPIRPGRIYVAPPDYHLLLKPGRVRVARGPRENGHRPAADALFRTAARAYGSRVAGVVLSGVLDDGTAGLVAVKERGGVALVQDPGEALYDGMPRSALENVVVDICAPVRELAPILVDLATRPLSPPAEPPPSEQMQVEADMAELDLDALQRDDRPGVPAGFSCPDCGGTLFELHESGLVRYRCRVGHAWSPGSLLAQQSSTLEAAFWTALRALEEKAALARRLVQRALSRGQAQAATVFAAHAREAEQQAALVRSVLLNGGEPPVDPTAVPAAVPGPAPEGNGQ